jgi:putative membrane protein
MPGASDWNRISPLSALFFVFRLLRQIAPQAAPGLLVLFAALFGSETGARGLLPYALGAIVIALLGFGVLSWLRFRYRVAEERVLVRQGVLQREQLDIDFDRIQNITIREPFYMRPLGLAVLGIDTAGSSGKEIELAGIDHGLALEIRTRLLEHAGDKLEVPVATPGTAAATEPVPTDGSVLLALSRRDVLLYGLTANVMLWAALALGAFFGSGDIAETTIDAVIAHPGVQDTAMTLKRHGGGLLLGLAIAGVALLILLTLPLVSMLGALFRYDGYRLTLHEETFRRNSGLLTRHDESLRRHKIQAVVWKQNFAARWLGRINLQVRQASAGAGSADGNLPGAGRGPFLVPALEPPEAAKLTGLFLPGSDSDAVQFSPVDAGRYLRVNLAIVLVLSALPLLLPAVLVHPAWMALLAPISAIAWIIIRRVSLAFGWAVDGDFGYVRQGFIGHTTTVFPLFKVQRVDIRQTPVQHRRGIAHLTIHLASHSLTVPYVRIEDAGQLRDLALYAAESSHERWY